MDVGHYWSGDLLVGATGDLLAAGGAPESRQRILRRLLTNPTRYDGGGNVLAAGDYLWHPDYGAGLPARVGLPLDEAALDSLITSQMYREQTVVQSPAPQITAAGIPNGLSVRIQYVERDSSQPTTLNFDVTP